jgi:hypothetical protein
MARRIVVVQKPGTKTICEAASDKLHLEGVAKSHCRSTHSRLSQAATCSSGMWCQEMLPSILHDFHFDIISSFSIKNFVPDISDQTLYAQDTK